jgi:hypothetical protein
MNPNNPILRSHKTMAKIENGNIFSSRVTKNIRIIWNYGDEVDTIDVADIGGHEGGDKVYK